MVFFLNCETLENPLGPGLEKNLNSFNIIQMCPHMNWRFFLIKWYTWTLRGTLFLWFNIENERKVSTSLGRVFLYNNPSLSNIFADIFVSNWFLATILYNCQFYNYLAIKMFTSLSALEMSIFPIFAFLKI